MSRMIAIGLLLTFLGCGSTDEVQPPAPAAPPQLLIEYSSAGFEAINYRDGHLEFTWHTPKDPGPVEGLNPLRFERREYKGTLSPQQVALIWDWANRSKVFDLKPPDFAGAARTYASFFKSSLKVEAGDRKLLLNWTAEDSFPYLDPRKTMDSLVGICKDFAAEAEKKLPSVSGE